MHCAFIIHRQISWASQLARAYSKPTGYMIVRMIVRMMMNEQLTYSEAFPLWRDGILQFTFTVESFSYPGKPFIRCLVDTARIIRSFFIWLQGYFLYQGYFRFFSRSLMTGSYRISFLGNFKKHDLWSLQINFGSLSLFYN